MWERYPATLYVTVKGIMPPENLPPVLRSRNALQGELSQSSPLLEVDQNHREGDTRSDQENSAVSSQVLWNHHHSLFAIFQLPHVTERKSPYACHVIIGLSEGRVPLILDVGTKLCE